jgi:hypothetical protein
MVGDTSDYVKFVSIVKKKVQAPVFPRDCRDSENFFSFLSRNSSRYRQLSSS